MTRTDDVMGRNVSTDTRDYIVTSPTCAVASNVWLAATVVCHRLTGVPTVAAFTWRHGACVASITTGL